MQNGPISLGEYARQMLQVFDNRIAYDRPEVLLFMTVGAGRLRLLGDVIKQMRRRLAIGRDAEARGMYAMAVLGQFGGGKSHLGYLLKHDALNCGEELLVSHVQIAGNSQFSGVLATLLRSLQLAGVPSQEVGGVNVSAYQLIYNWAGGKEGDLRRLISRALGDMNPMAGYELGDALLDLVRPAPSVERLRQYIEKWVGRTEPNEALEVFELILRVFRLVKVDRLVLIVDEFEAIQSQSSEAQRETLQHILHMHDRFAEPQNQLPATFLLAMATADWWMKGQDLCPPLLGEGQRFRQAPMIPDLEPTDVAALVYRYASLYQLAHDEVKKEIKSSDLRQLTDSVWTQVSPKSSHVRFTHSEIRRQLEDFLEL